MTGILPPGSSSNPGLIEEFEDKVTVTKQNKATNLSGNTADQVTLLSLHEDVFQEILSKLSYDDVARVRLVCFSLLCYGLKSFWFVKRLGTFLTGIPSL